jgi:DNA-binding CsgD family transcriptional regulator
MAAMLPGTLGTANPSEVGFSVGWSGFMLTAMSGRERDRRRCRERLETLAGATLDADEARRSAIEELRRAVGFERWCWPLTDPSSVVSTDGIGQVDFWSSLARLVALEHGDDVTSKPALLAGNSASVALSTATGGDLARSRRWRECMRAYGIGDELMTVCRDRHGCWGSVELMRDSDDAPFDHDDQRLLDELAPILGALLRRSLLRSWQAGADDGNPRAPGTLILDAELRPTGWTPSFRQWLSELPPSGPDPTTLPPAVYELGARTLAVSDAVSALPNRVRIRTSTGRWSAIEGAPLEGGEGGQVAITVRDATATEIFDMLCRAHDLTRRERQLAALVLRGLSTDQLARTLYISPYTVKDHLKAIFDLAGVRSRRELRAELTGR